jgi:hypothetical protein
MFRRPSNPTDGEELSLRTIPADRLANRIDPITVEVMGSALASDTIAA